jgi:signal transduction histidine kinase
MGLTESERARLFSLFSQGDASTTRKHGGTGLGLAFAKKIVEMMGGKIWCDSRTGEGNSFNFMAFLRSPR